MKANLAAGRQRRERLWSPVLFETEIRNEASPIASELP